MLAPVSYLFVYGTLKTGFTNYQRYLHPALVSDKMSLVDTATTADTFPLVVRPVNMLPATCGPVLMDTPTTGAAGHQISGELYQILDPSALEAMDILEGVKAGFYYKRDTVVIIPSGARLTALCYFYPPNDELLKLPFLTAYTATEHDLYRPPEAINQDILKLCT